MRERLNGLVFGIPDDPTHADHGPDGHDGERDLLGWVKTAPGRLSLNTMLDEIGKLEDGVNVNNATQATPTYLLEDPREPVPRL